MKLSLTGLTLTFGLMAKLAMADEYQVDQEVFIDMEGYFSITHSTPFVGITIGTDYWTLDWQAVRDMLESESDLISKEALIEACQMLHDFRDKNADTFIEYNIDPLSSLPPEWYDCSSPTQVAKNAPLNYNAFS